jgi:hypothetical protein
MDPDVTSEAESSNGLPSGRFAAIAASVRSKLNRVAQLLESGDISAAQVVLAAVLLELTPPD